MADDNATDSAREDTAPAPAETAETAETVEDPGTEPGTVEPTEPDAAESAPTESAPAESESDSEPAAGEPEAAEKPAAPAVTGTTPAWWAWVARHPKPVALVAALVVVAVVATVVTVAVTATQPRDVVRSYLDAIQAGDTDTALEIAEKSVSTDQLTFLTADALADDWSVDAIVERHRRDNEADVDVTITAGEVSEQGRFHLVKEADEWTIEAPLVQVDLQLAGVETVELGGVRQAVPDVPRAQGGTVSLMLFPGVYDLYPSFAEQVRFDPGVLVAAPRPSVDETLRLTASYALTRDGAAAANEEIAARVEECATRPDLNPRGCPFDAEDERALFGYRDVTGIAWAVTRAPDAVFVPGDTGGVEVVVRQPGTATLTGSGIPYEPEGAAAEPFSVTCEFGVDNLALVLTADGLAVNGSDGRPYVASQTTNCF